MIRKLLSTLALSLVAIGAHAQTYKLFRPANGILVGQTSTYVTSAASSSNVISLWSGTCNGSSFLRGDGACAAASTAPGGADTQVQFNNAGAFGGDAGMTYNSGTDALSVVGQILVPQITAATSFILNSVGGDAVSTWNSSGYTLDFNANLMSYTVDGAENVSFFFDNTWTASVFGGGASITLDASTNNVSLSSPTGDISIDSDGDDVIIQSLDDTTISAESFVVSVGGAATINGSNICRADGTGCPAGASGANPTATIGLSATNGVAATFLRSDGAPALSQSIVPTWSGLHSFTASGWPGTAGAQLISAAEARTTYNETDAAANNRRWQIYAETERFIGAAVNDADSARTAWLTVDRTANTIDTIDLLATTVSVNGQSVRNTALFTAGTLGVARGGTNLTSAADDNVMVGDSSTWESKAVPDCDDTGGNHLNYDTGTNTFSCGTSGSAGAIAYARVSSAGAIQAGNGTITLSSHPATGDYRLTIAGSDSDTVCVTSLVAGNGHASGNAFVSGTTHQVVTYSSSVSPSAAADLAFNIRCDL
jgi:hypothetical protein